MEAVVFMTLKFICMIKQMAPILSESRSNKLLSQKNILFYSKFTNFIWIRTFLIILYISITTYEEKLYLYKTISTGFKVCTKFNLDIIIRLELFKKTYVFDNAGLSFCNVFTKRFRTHTHKKSFHGYISYLLFQFLTPQFRNRYRVYRTSQKDHFI